MSRKEGNMYSFAEVENFDPEIAKAIGKDAHYVRIGIQQGILKFGVAMKMADSNEFSYYCSDRKVWEETGYFNGEVKKQGKEKALA